MTIYHINSINNNGMEVQHEETSIRTAVIRAKEDSSVFNYAEITAPGERGKFSRQFEHGKEIK